MDDILKTIAEKFNNREMERLIRVAVYKRSSSLNDELVSETVDKLISAVIKKTKRDGYKEPVFKDFAYSHFKWGEKIGFLLSVNGKKDENASIIFAIARHYEEITASLSEKIDNIEKVISESKSIDDAREKLKGIAHE